MLPHNYMHAVSGGKEGLPREGDWVPVDTLLFDLVHDPCEKLNVIERYPEIARTLIDLAEEHKTKFFSDE